MSRSHPTGSGRTADRRRHWIDQRLVSLCLASVALTGVAGLVQVSFGDYTMSLAETWRTVLDPAVATDLAVWQAFLLGSDLPEMTRQQLVVWNIRLPRVLVGVLAGATLAVSGAVFQAVTRNELASPFVLGVSSGAGFAVLLTLVVFSGLTPFLPLFAAAGGAVAFLLVYVIAWKGGTTPVRLVLAGIVVSMIFHSLQQGLFYLASDLGAVQSAIAWTTGSLTGTDWEQVRMALVPGAVAVALSLLGARQLNLLLLGEQTARSLGMRVETVRFGMAGLAILAASTAIAVAGIVSFVGLVVPHVVRTLVGSDYRRIVVGCVFVGPTLLVGADVIARLALDPIQVPVGVVTGLIGGPYFLYLMRKRQSMGEL
jgi:iron complex transport system permease protein